MSASNFHGVVNGSIENGSIENGSIENGSIERNGTPARTTVSTRGGRTAPAKRLDRPAKPGPEPAGFVRSPAHAQDAPMWPIHPVMWLQPDLRLAVPASSGLHIERRHTIPSPDFLRGSMTAAATCSGHPPALEKTVQPVLPRVGRQYPSSGLAPLGWDPRVASHGSGKEDQE